MGSFLKELTFSTVRVGVLPPGIQALYMIHREVRVETYSITSKGVTEIDAAPGGAALLDSTSNLFIAGCNSTVNFSDHLFRR